MNFPKRVLVTEQDVDLTKLTELQKTYFLLLADHIKAKYLESGLSRFVVSISGPSGSGKSVLSKIIEQLLKNEEGFMCQTIDLDAFHYPNDELKKKGLLKIKGRYDTYNTKQLEQLLNLFRNNHVVTFPRYSREDHEPHTDGPITDINNTILLLPGLWIQRDDADWSKIREQVDYTIVIEGDVKNFKQNTVTRHITGGRSKKDAEEFYRNSDLINTEEILQNSSQSNLHIPYFENIQREKDLKFT